MGKEVFQNWRQISGGKIQSLKWVSKNQITFTFRTPNPHINPISQPIVLIPYQWENKNNYSGTLKSLLHWLPTVFSLAVWRETPPLFQDYLSIVAYPPSGARSPWLFCPFALTSSFWGHKHLSFTKPLQPHVSTGQPSDMVSVEWKRTPQSRMRSRN